MMPMKFQEAIDAWLELRDSIEEEMTDRLEAVEVFLLNWKPKSMMEAAMLCEVVAHSMDCGERSDGLDRRAVRNLRSFLLPR